MPGMSLARGQPVMTTAVPSHVMQPYDAEQRVLRVPLGLHTRTRSFEMRNGNLASHMRNREHSVYSATESVCSMWCPLLSSPGDNSYGSKLVPKNVVVYY